MNVGILGGGQLARMMAQAGDALGLSFMFLCPDPHAPAAPFGTLLCAPYTDRKAQDRLAEWSDVVTYEFENIPLSTLESLQQQVTLHPSAAALAVACDRLTEKRRFSSLGIPTARFVPVETLDELTAALKDIGFPAILKTRTQGYDGKGQAYLATESDLAPAWERLGQYLCIVESVVPFKRELSIIAVRDLKGEIVFYPVSENHHREGILRLSINRLNDPLQSKANAMIQKIMEDLDYVGTMALELFQVEDQLFANEFAPRVHNSGHWTIEAAPASQFENHLRAIGGLPLGSTTPIKPAAMINLIGCLPEENKVLEVPGTRAHFYGKEARPGRKMGHITLTGEDCALEEFDRRLTVLLELSNEPELASENLLAAPS